MTNLIIAIDNNDVNKATELIDNLIDINHNIPSTLLMYAVAKNRIQIVTLFLNKGANPEIKSFYDGESPLHCAARYGFVDIIILLLERGTNIDIETENSKETPLHIAVNYGHIKVVEILLERGANIHAVDHYGETPLHIASLYDYTGIIKLLLNKGADIEAEDINNRTPLFNAVRKGCGFFDTKINTVSTLLECGANFEACDIHNTRLIDFAINNGASEEIIKMLQEAINNQEDTLLFMHNAFDVDDDT